MEVISTNWQIITGSPSSGKSTTLSGIAFRGYKIIPEAARVFIDEEMSRGKSIEKIRSSELKFQQAVLEIKIKVEKMLNPDELIFFERGIWDSIPFMELAGATASEMQAVVSERTYRNVFLLEQVSFEKDYARTENAEKAFLLNELLFRTYSERGYSVIKVPVMPISNRVDFILKNLKNDRDN